MSPEEEISQIVGAHMICYVGVADLKTHEKKCA
jgi:hypothetical protein